MLITTGRNLEPVSVFCNESLPYVRSKKTQNKMITETRAMLIPCPCSHQSSRSHGICLFVSLFSKVRYKERNLIKNRTFWNSDGINFWSNNRMETESVRRLHKKFHVACKNKDFRRAIFLGNLLVVPRLRGQALWRSLWCFILFLFYFFLNQALRRKNILKKNTACYLKASSERCRQISMSLKLRL